MSGERHENSGQRHGSSGQWSVASECKEIRLFSSRADEKRLLDEAASPREGGASGCER